MDSTRPTCTDLIIRYIKSCDIRFEDKRDEASFRASLEPDVLRSGFFVAFLLLIIIPFALIPTYAREADSSNLNPFQLARPDVRNLTLGVWLCSFTVTGAFVTAAMLRIWKEWFMSWNWERLMMIVVTWYALSLSLANFWHLPLICGKDPEKVWHRDPRGTEVYILLAMDGLMTMVAMYVPVRSCAFWVLPLCGAGTYSVLLLVVDSVFPEDRHLTISALLGLAFLSIHGLHRNEKHMRERWLALQRVQEVGEVVKKQETKIQETAALVKGLRTVAEALCDIIVKLSGDLRVHGSERMHDTFFEREMEGHLFTEVLEDSDRGRFLSLVSEASKAHVPACMPVTLMKKFSKCEAHLLLVDTGRREPRYILGIRIETENMTTQQQDFSSLVPQPILNTVRLTDIDEDSDFSFTTFPKNDPAPPPFYTCVKARALSLRKLIPRWNVPRDIEGCCQFHTVVASIEDVVRYLADSPCEPLWSTLAGGQCARCKCMCTNARAKCVVCGYEAPSSGGSSSLR